MLMLSLDFETPSDWEDQCWWLFWFHLLSNVKSLQFHERLLWLSGWDILDFRWTDFFWSIWGLLAVSFELPQKVWALLYVSQKKPVFMSTLKCGWWSLWCGCLVRKAGKSIYKQKVPVCLQCVLKFVFFHAHLMSPYKASFQELLRGITKVGFN